MRHGIHVPPFGTFGDAKLLVELAQDAEEAGWDGFFLWDHILYEAEVPLADAWAVLAAMAVSTRRIRLGPLVTPLARRTEITIAAGPGRFGRRAERVAQARARRDETAWPP